jgi:hypothetical protein
MILGSGSASFEILRCGRTPSGHDHSRWFAPKPTIAISNVIGYLVGCLEHRNYQRSTTSADRTSDLPAAAEICAGSLRKRVIIPVGAATLTLLDQSGQRCEIHCLP